MHIIVWLIIGFVAGLIARAIVPGKQSMGIIATTLLGIAGSLIGGLVGHALSGGGGGEFAPSGIIGSIIGAIVLLLILGAVQRRRHVPA